MLIVQTTASRSWCSSPRQSAPLALLAFAILSCDLPKIRLPATTLAGQDAAPSQDATRADLSRPKDGPVDLPLADGKIRTCLSLDIDLNKPVANVILVSDRSAILAGSNKGKCAGCTTYWNSFKEAAWVIANNFDDRFRWGMKLFPTPSSPDVCYVNPAALDVPVSPDGASALQRLLETAAPSGEAPARLALRAATDILSKITDPAPKMIVLAMGALPTCGAAGTTIEDSARTLDEIRRTVLLGIPVYLLGLGLRDSQLAPFAIEGYTTFVYSTDDPQSLLMDMQLYAMDYAPCSYTLPTPTMSSADIQVFFNEHSFYEYSVKADPQNGFSLSKDGSVVFLNGTSCDTLRRPYTTTVTIKLFCPG